MLDPNVDSLFQVAVANLLVDYDPDRGFGDIVDDSRLAVIDFVRHSAGCQIGFCPNRMENKASMLGTSDPFWTAPFAFISTISPTLWNCQRHGSVLVDISGVLVLSQVSGQFDHALLLEVA